MSHVGFCYPHDEVYRYIDIEHDNGVRTRTFYVEPFVYATNHVDQGDPIGKCQDVAARYGPPMENHYHFEVILRWEDHAVVGRNGETFSNTDSAEWLYVNPMLMTNPWPIGHREAAIDRLNEAAMRGTIHNEAYDVPEDTQRLIHRWATRLGRLIGRTS